MPHGSTYTILVAGMIAGDPRQGGTAWSVLQYVLGLRELGHDVYFVEPVASRKLRPVGASLRSSTSASYFRDVVRQFGLKPKAALLLRDAVDTVGCSYETLRSIASRCDLLINLSGVLTDPALLERIPVRLYVDLDPAFNQLWHACAIDVGFERHTHFATIGLGLGHERCAVPTCDRAWIPTRQPIVLSEWPVTGREPVEAFTTSGNGRGLGSITHDGVFYGQKAHALRQFISLPAKSGQRMLLAFAPSPEETKDVSRLTAEGWQLVDPEVVAGTPDQYRHFIQGSLAEFGIAKSGYATSRCGWFSDRSVCYLASGRPVIAQETGFSSFLPTDEGLFAFETEDQALAAMDAVVGDYPRHSRAARAIAEEYFDANIVLPLLLERVGVLG
jgi:hypothetical protein